MAGPRARAGSSASAASRDTQWWSPSVRARALVARQAQLLHREQQAHDPLVVLHAAALDTPVAKDFVVGSNKPAGCVCPPGRRPYHTILTAQASTYQRWQTLIFYHHFRKVQTLQPWFPSSFDAESARRRVPTSTWTGKFLASTAISSSLRGCTTACARGGAACAVAGAGVQPIASTSRSAVAGSGVPRSEMFGYSNTLRSATQGKAEFCMEFARYSQVPGNV